MSRAEKELSPEYARALIKQAIGIINGDAPLVAEATAEIAVILDTASTERPRRGGHRPRIKSPPARKA